jgi:hypothetical protein
MRIAVCLSGQPRTWRATCRSLLDFFAGHDLDVFLHSWTDEDPAELDALARAYAPRAVSFEPRPLFAAEKRRMAERFPTRPPLTIFDMFHSIARSLDLALQSGETYDLVARARYDALFDGRWAEGAVEEGAVVVPDIYPEAAGCTDQFAVGRPGAMALYGGAGGWLKEALEALPAEPWLRPEPALRLYLEQACGLKVELRPIAMKLLRSEQLGRAFEAVVDDPVFHAAKHEAWEAFAQAQFPDLAPRIDFAHHARTALALERGLTAWLASHPAQAAERLLRSPWPERLQAIDAFIGEQAGGGLESLDDQAYRTVRMLCAALLQRMPLDEPMGPEGFVVHALSANAPDMQRARAWAGEERDRLDKLAALLPALGPLAKALALANPLDQPPLGAWRPRPETSAG